MSTKMQFCQTKFDTYRSFFKRMITVLQKRENWFSKWIFICQSPNTAKFFPHPKLFHIHVLLIN